MKIDPKLYTNIYDPNPAYKKLSEIGTVSSSPKICGYKVSVGIRLNATKVCMECMIVCV